MFDLEFEMNTNKKLAYQFLQSWLLSIIVCAFLTISGMFIANGRYDYLMPFIAFTNVLVIVIGVFSFVFMIFYKFKGFALEHTSSITKQNAPNPENSHATSPRFNFSIKRVISRLFLTLIVSIIFHVSTFPFLRRAEGLLDTQQAAIGTGNILRVAVLWSVFSALALFLTFSKKRFRMVSTLLVCVWVVGVCLFLFTSIKSLTDRSCKRSDPYPMPQEVERALSLIAQRMGVNDALSTYLALAYKNRNCISIQYSETPYGLEGMFIQTEDLQKMEVYMRGDYQGFDDLSIATILVHELSHVGQHLDKELNDAQIDCFDDEAEAFLNQAVFLSQLNAEEQRSIFTRLEDNQDLNPAFGVVLLTSAFTNESYDACVTLQNANNLSQEQFNDCVWTGVRNKLKEVVMESEYYQLQCRDR